MLFPVKFFDFDSELFVLLFLHIQFLLHLNVLFLLFLEHFLGFIAFPGVRLSFLQFPLKLKQEALVLASLLFFLGIHYGQLVVLILHVVNQQVLLLEFLLYDFKFFRVCEGIFTLYYFFQLVTQTGALVHVHFHLDFYLCYFSALYVPFESFNFVAFDKDSLLHILDFSL